MFRRGCELEEVTIKHYSYLWAAFRRGLLPIIPDDTSNSDFTYLMTEIFKDEISRGNDFWIGVGETRLGKIPVGLCWSLITEEYAHPHVVWFPEASDRNKIELSAKYLLYLKQRHKVIIMTDLGGFYLHLAKYGIVRRVGFLRKFASDATDLQMFQGVI